MADTSATATAQDETEKRRQHWTKESIERRRDFLEKKGCDPELIKKMEGKELVQKCLIAEGLIAGTLPKKQETVEVGQTQGTIDPMTVVLQLMQQMRADNERREKYEKEQREEEKKEAIRQEQQALKREEEIRQRDEEIRQQALKREEEMRQREDEIRTQNLRREEDIREQARQQEERYEKQMRAQIEAFERMQEAKVHEDQAAREGRLAKEESKENKIKIFGDLLKKVLFT